MQLSMMRSKLSTASVSGRTVSAPCKATRSSRRTTSVVRAEADKKAGVNVKATKHVAVGGLENPGSPEVFANIDSGGRLPNGKKKTVRVAIMCDDLISRSYLISASGHHHRSLVWPRPAYC